MGVLPTISWCFDQESKNKGMFSTIEALFNPGEPLHYSNLEMKR